jgi:hypothetical protein
VPRDATCCRATELNGYPRIPGYNSRFLARHKTVSKFYNQEPRTPWFLLGTGSGRAAPQTELSMLRVLNSLRSRRIARSRTGFGATGRPSFRPEHHGNLNFERVYHDRFVSIAVTGSLEFDLEGHSRGSAVG